LIYWILPVVTTIIQITTLQHINQRLVFSVWYHFGLNLSSCVSNSLSVSSVSHPLKTVLCKLNRGHHMEVHMVVQMISCCYENNCLPSRYNGTASVHCLGNYFSVLAFRHFITICFMFDIVFLRVTVFKIIKLISVFSDHHDLMIMSKDYHWIIE
jgi:hypothetical protein